MIHYHGLPMTPVLALLRAMQGKHAMVSYERPHQLPEAAEICQSVALDNGSFSAWRQGKPYDFSGYYEWCEKWLKHPAVDWAVIPDIIDGDEEANERLLSQWPHGKNHGVPVWHLHEGLARLKWLVTSRWPRVALGSSGKYAVPGSQAWWHRIAGAMRVVCDDDGLPLVKLHGLRMLDPVLFSHIPFASADSANVGRNLGIDERWLGPYAPQSKATRATIMIDRVEAHAAASRWSGESSGVQQNMELLG
jgi:hypothetical protein